MGGRQRSPEDGWRVWIEPGLEGLHNRAGFGAVFAPMRSEHIRSLFLTTLFMGAATLQSSGQPLPTGQPLSEGMDPARLKRVRAVVDEYLEEGRHAGAVWAIARHGKLLDFQAAGSRDLEAGLPMEKDTICRIYSMSKIVTSVGVLILMEEGALALDDSIEKHLPELKEPNVFTGGTAEAPQLAAAKAPVTLRHLLSHTSGYIYDFEGNDALAQMYKRADLWNSDSLEGFIAKVTKLPLKHHPGEAFSYGINNDILGAMIERVSGRSFEDFLRERIFQPLGMKDTSFDVAPEKRQRLAKIYQNGQDGKLVEAQDFLGTYEDAGRGIPCGGAGLFSTVSDYTRFAQMLLNGGELEGRRILGRKTVELMTANHLVMLPGEGYAFTPAKGFGLGVEVQLDLGFSPTLASPGQFGWYGAATTYCQVDPRERLVAVLFVQHFPFNQHGIFPKFQNAFFQALTR
jgi:CubicO group peptidase (beta-lactamase class C family)